jgi:peptide/nickel transport system permease protein
VTTMLGSRLPVTASLAGLALLMAAVLGVLLGLASSWRPNGVLDRLIALVCAVGVATPAFLIGLVLAIFLAVERRWLPATGYIPLSEGFGPWFRHLALPALALTALPAAEIARQLRGSMIETLDRDYVLAARAKGLAPSAVRLKHALKNAAIPPVTVLGFRVAQMLGGAVVIERVFALPGLGQLTVESVLGRDYVTLLGVVLLLAAIVSVVNLLVDVSYVYFNPKLRTA